MALFGEGRQYVLKIVADVTDAVKGVDTVAEKTSSMKDKMVGIGKAVATGVAVGAVVEFGKAAIDAAAAADDGADAIAAAFGPDSAATQSIAKFAKGAADNMGLSTAAYEEMAAKTGNLLQSLGINQDDAAKSTEVLSQRAADMAAIWGTDTPTAMEAINKALTGATKGLQQFGVKISANEIEAKAMAMGYKDASGKVTDAGKAIAAQQLILEKTANVQGAWADNSKDLGSQQEILKAKMENLQATLGQKLLPIIVKIMEFAAPIMDFLSKNAGWLAPIAGVIAGIVVAIKAWTIAQTALNIVLSANPLGLIVIAIAAVVAGIVLLYTKVDWFRAFVDGAIDGIVAAFQTFWDIVMAIFHWIQDNWPLLLAIITGPIGIAVTMIVKNWDTIKQAFGAVIDFITSTVAKVWDIITTPFVKAFDEVKRIVGNIPQAFRDVVGAITNALSTVWDVISAPFKKGFDMVKSAGQTIIDWLWGLGSAINNALSGVANVIKYPFETAFNAIKTLWNNTVGKISFKIPDWVPGIGGKGFSFPKMATGGIVTRPMIAMIGEAGPEAVIPLNQMQSVAATTQPVIINVYALDATAQTGRRVYDSLREYARVSGSQLVIGNA